MEKRTSERQMSVRDVTIGYSNLGIVKGRTVDISLGGMCVDTGSMCLPENAPVSVNFVVETSAGDIHCDAHAIVVRVEGSECCLMFDGMNPQTHRALRSLVGDWQILPGSKDMEQVAAL